MVHVGQLPGGEIAEFIEHTGMPDGQPLRHLCFGLAGDHHARRHEIDHFFQAPFAHGRDLFRQQPIEQGQGGQQGARGRFVAHFEHERPAAGPTATFPIRLHGQHFALQGKGFGLAHDAPPATLFD